MTLKVGWLKVIKSHYYLLLKTSVAFQIHFTYRCFMPSMVDISPIFLEKIDPAVLEIIFPNVVNVLSLFRCYLPLEGRGTCMKQWNIQVFLFNYVFYGFIPMIYIFFLSDEMFFPI